MLVQYLFCRLFTQESNGAISETLSLSVPEISLKMCFSAFGDLHLFLENFGSKMFPNSSLIYLYSTTQGKFGKYYTLPHLKVNVYLEK
jgi:hypothetical protein